MVYLQSLFVVCYLVTFVKSFTPPPRPFFPESTNHHKLILATRTIRTTTTTAAAAAAAAVATLSPQSFFLFPYVGISQRSSSSSTSLLLSNDNTVEITFPTPDEAAKMGIRDWPQQYHSVSWTEYVSEGQILTRYVLDGKGRVGIDYFHPVTGNSVQRKERVYPGTLIEVDGEATLVWEVDDETKGMIVLTPSFEEGGKLLVVAGFFVAFCAVLLAGVGF